MSDDPDYVIKTLRRRHGTYSWRGQALQYDQFGPPNGIVYHRFYGGSPVDTLLHYDEDGVLDAILNTYPEGHFDGTWVESPGNINTFQRPGADGMARLLVDDAVRRWPGCYEIVAEWEKAHPNFLGGTLPDGQHRITRLPPK